jgi:hypothetical protein
MRRTPRVLTILTAAAVLLVMLTFATAQLLIAEEIPPAAKVGTSAAAPADDAAKPSVAPAPKIALDTKEVSGILGKEVLSATGEKMGRIIDVLVDRAGVARAAVIDFGGFLGVGSRKVAVDWNALHFGAEKGQPRITLLLTREQLKAAPQIQEGKSIIILGAGDVDLSRLTATAPEH